MGVYYKFYRPYDMELLDEGKFAGMPFDMNDCPKVMEVMDEDPCSYNIDYCRTGIMDRKMAKEFQAIMPTNNTFFTDLMDKNNTYSLIYRIE